MPPVFIPSIESIHASGKRLVLAVTGGGSSAISSLLIVPGASRSVLEAIVPYDQQALEEWVGGKVEQACSLPTARAMAMAAFQRSAHLSHEDQCSELRGIACTAGLATDRPKRGPHRVHVAWQSIKQTVSLSLELEKGARSRAEEEQIASGLVLLAVAEACDVSLPNPASWLPKESIRRDECIARDEWSELLLGKRKSVPVAPLESNRTGFLKLLFPGAFNPLHSGHIAMASYAEARLGQLVTFELSIANVDKPPLDFIEIRDRLAQFTGRSTLLTHAPTFLEKSRIAPGVTFIVGVDTMERIGDAKYYGGEQQRDVAVKEILRSGCRFLVFGRADASGFRELNSIELPRELREVCEGISEAEFRAEVSSTKLRRENS